MGNAFVHVELNTTDLGKAKSFYQDLFDWELEDMPMEDGESYTMIEVGDGTGGGMMKHPMPGKPSIWVPYIMVDDVSDSTAKAKELGGQILKDKTEVKEMGWFSVIMDPTGAVFGLWETNPDYDDDKD